MGLFSRKKKIEVPAPPSEDLLKFPKASEVTVIKPETIKEAVGVEKPAPPLPEAPPARISKEDLVLPKETQEMPSFPPPRPTFPLPPPETPSFRMKKPFFLRIQDYQKLFDSLSHIRNKTIELDQTTENIEKSGFNENKDYERLKNDLKKIHDRLLFMDDIVFKK